MSSIWQVRIHYTSITKRRRSGWVFLRAASEDVALFIAVMWFKAQHPEMPRNPVRASRAITVLPEADWDMPFFQPDKNVVWVRRNKGKNGRRVWVAMTPETKLSRKFTDEGEPTGNIDE